jgi:hypothetical protein
MRRRFTVLATLLCASLLLSGCNSSTTGQPAAKTSASATSGLPTDGAPAVVDPLTNTASVETDPCSAMTVAGVESIGGKVESTRVNDLSLGKSCVWIFAEFAGTVSAGMVVGNKDGLSSLYYQSKHGGLTTFKPVAPIKGYPGVIYENGGEGKGVCTLAVGVRDDLVYTITNQLRTGNPYLADPCGLNTKVAELAIQRLKGA